MSTFSDQSPKIQGLSRQYKITVTFFFLLSFFHFPSSPARLPQKNSRYPYKALLTVKQLFISLTAYKRTNLNLFLAFSNLYLAFFCIIIGLLWFDNIVPTCLFSSSKSRNTLKYVIDSVYGAVDISTHKFY